MGQEPVHVVVGVIQNSNNEVLVSRRKPNTHLAGLLEFPGGKVEQNELPIEALRRELSEELAIDIKSTTPLIQIPYRYPDCNLWIDVFLVNEYSGTITSHEGQEIIWKHASSIDDTEFPDANFGIIKALTLPKILPVTPDSSGNENFIPRFENVVCRSEVEIIQLRSHNISDREFKSLAKECVDLCDKNNVKLILNREVDTLEGLKFSGMHLTSKSLLCLKERPLGLESIVGASCHNAMEIEKANQLRLDYVFVGAVLEKFQDKTQAVLTWDGFANLIKDCQIPAYAIGGVNSININGSIRSGGQGIAAIRSTWTDSSVN